MPAIRVKENEPFEVAMRRFKRAIEKTGLRAKLTKNQLLNVNAKKQQL